MTVVNTLLSSTDLQEPDLRVRARHAPMVVMCPGSLSWPRALAYSLKSSGCVTISMMCNYPFGHTDYLPILRVLPGGHSLHPAEMPILSKASSLRGTPFCVFSAWQPGARLHVCCASVYASSAARSRILLMRLRVLTLALCSWMAARVQMPCVASVKCF